MRRYGELYDGNHNHGSHGLVALFSDTSLLQPLFSTDT